MVYAVPGLCVSSVSVLVTSGWILIRLKCYSSQFCIIFSFALSVSFYEKGRWRNSAAAWFCIFPSPSHYWGSFSTDIIAWPPAGMCHHKPLSPVVQPVLNLLSCLLLWFLPCQFAHENIGRDSSGSLAEVKVHISRTVPSPTEHLSLWERSFCFVNPWWQLPVITLALSHFFQCYSKSLF